MDIPVIGNNHVLVSEAELDALRKLAELEKTSYNSDTLGFVKASELRSLLYNQIRETLVELDQIRLVKEDVGVVIGRFQTPILHFGHRYVIDSAMGRHEGCLVLIGVTNKRDKNNPLPYAFRRDLIQESYPTATVLPVVDVHSDEEWSLTVDQVIKLAFPNKSARLYGGRDSFIPKYSGKFPATELPMIPIVSGTQIREMLKRVDRSTPEFRAGIIYATMNMEEEQMIRKQPIYCPH